MTVGEECKHAIVQQSSSLTSTIGDNIEDGWMELR